MHRSAGWTPRLAAVLLIVISAAAARAAAQPVFFPTPQKAAFKAEAPAAKAFTLKADKNVSFATTNEYASFLREWGFEEKRAASRSPSRGCPSRIARRLPLNLTRKKPCSTTPRSRPISSL